MTYELTDEQLQTVAGYRAYLSTEDSRSALDCFIEAAKIDTVLKFVPKRHGSRIDKTVKFQFNEVGRTNQSAYAFIVNKSDLRFYYRSPCGRVSDTLASQLTVAGLEVEWPNDHEIAVRIRNAADARIVIEDCFPVPLGVTLPKLQILEAQFEAAVELALQRPADECAARLVNAPKIPQRVEVSTYAFVRNADVVATVLRRAEGHCEECSAVAPFFRKKDGTPYLEVHHRKRLADGGEDTVANAIAVCPNCHRQKHHG